MIFIYIIDKLKPDCYTQNTNSPWPLPLWAHVRRGGDKVKYEKYA